MTNKQGLQFRTVVSIVVTWGFLLLAVTGLVLYIQPHGMVAYWTRWSLLGLGKDHWDGVHVVSGWIFLVAGALHVWLNWKPLLRHLGASAERGWRLRRELLLATAICLLVAAGGLWHVPPVGWLLDLNAAAKSAWIGQPSDKPPFGHAEMVSLRRLSSQMDFDMDVALAELERRGIDVSSPEQTLDEIARDNDTSPAAIYEIIQPGASAGQGGGQGRGGGGGD